MPPVDLAQQFTSVVTDANRPTQLATPSGPANEHDLTVFSPANAETVCKLLSSIDTHKACGSDGIPGCILKQCAQVLAPSLTTLINMSLSSGIVPQILKRADVRPLFKSGDPTLAKNYRPVSLLPIVSKLLECVVQQQLRRHLEEHHVLPDCQFAYRHNYSTEDALFLATDRFLEAKDRAKHTGLVLVDMSKAFDKVRHNLLCGDLFACGVGGIALEWFKSYLSNRVQRVVVPGLPPTAYSSCSCGVPQGSVLGPVLFSLYTRSVPTIMSELNVQCQLFADDIMLDISDTSVDVINRHLSSAVSALSRYLSARGLILNAAKTQVMAMPAGRCSLKLDVQCNGEVLAQTPEARYLGFILDEQLNGVAHVNFIRSKVSKKLGAMWRARRSMSRALSLLYYKAVILPDILYASTSFYPLLSVTSAQPLSILCKRSVRCVMLAPPRTHSRPLFAQLGVHDYRHHINTKMAVLMHRFVNKHASPLLCARVEPVVRSDSIRTRSLQQHNLCLPPPSRVSGQKRPLYVGTSLWNTLPVRAKLESDAQKFKSFVRSVFLP